MAQKQTLGILVGGGPAPGINGVIAAATIEAIDSGLRVIGIPQGYYWLERGDASHAVELRIPDVSRIHFTGGSILGTSRTNPAREEESLERTLRALEALSVRYLVCIGGEDTTSAAAKIAIPILQCYKQDSHSLCFSLSEFLREDATLLPNLHVHASHQCFA